MIFFGYKRHLTVFESGEEFHFGRDPDGGAQWHLRNIRGMVGGFVIVKVGKSSSLLEVMMIGFKFGGGTFDAQPAGRLSNINIHLASVEKAGVRAGAQDYDLPS